MAAQEAVLMSPDLLSQILRRTVEHNNFPAFALVCSMWARGVAEQFAAMKLLEHDMTSGKVMEAASELCFLPDGNSQHSWTVMPRFQKRDLGSLN